MLEKTAEAIESVLAAAREGVAEAIEALKRTFDVSVDAKLDEPGTLASMAGKIDLNRAGLVVVLKMQAQAALIAISADALTPAWCANPDKTGVSKLATLAQELGMNLFPDTWMADDFVTHWVPNLADALARGEVPADGPAIPIGLAQNVKAIGAMALVWPATKAGDIPVKASEVPAPPAAAANPPASPRPQTPKPATAATRTPPTFTSGPPVPRVIHAKDLPTFTRTLLQIKVPVVVTLARKRHALSRVLELSPGAIIQFDKSCEEMLDLMIGNQPVAVGEAVKVGDKFGLRITSISSPDERFRQATPRELKPRT